MALREEPIFALRMARERLACLRGMPPTAAGGGAPLSASRTIEVAGSPAMVASGEAGFASTSPSRGTGASVASGLALSQSARVPRFCWAQARAALTLTTAETRIASTSHLQRRMRLGYSRAARIMDMLEADGIVGPAEGSNRREVLVPKDYFDEVDKQLR